MFIGQYCPKEIVKTAFISANSFLADILFSHFAKGLFFIISRDKYMIFSK